MAFGERFDRAFAFVSRLHRDQVRKHTSIPYITHLMAVAALVGEEGGTEDEVIAALCHDAAEDQGGQGTLDEIRSEFGNHVADIVAGCTDAYEIPKPPWKERKTAYLEHLASAPRSVRLVAACDKLHNARSIVRDLRQNGPSTWSRFNGGRDGTLWYYRSVVQALEQPGDLAIVAELRRVVDEMVELAGAS